MEWIGPCVKSYVQEQTSNILVSFHYTYKKSENNHKVSLDILSLQILLNFNNQLEDFC